MQEELVGAMRIQTSRTSQKNKGQVIVVCSTVIAAIATAAPSSSLANTARPAGVSAIARISASAPPAPRGWKPGWLVKQAAYVGRYRLLSSAGRDGKRNAHVTGALTLFLQRAYASKPPVPSGIISLHARKYDVVFYLTDLDHDGARLYSLVHGGSFLAPATGSFKLSKLAGGRIIGTLMQRGLATQTLTFKRFSTNPQP